MVCLGELVPSYHQQGPSLPFWVYPRLLFVYIHVAFAPKALFSELFDSYVVLDASFHNFAMFQNVCNMFDQISALSQNLMRRGRICEISWTSETKDKIVRPMRAKKRLQCFAIFRHIQNSDAKISIFSQSLTHNLKLRRKCPFCSYYILLKKVGRQGRHRALARGGTGQQAFVAR